MKKQTFLILSLLMLSVFSQAAIPSKSKNLDVLAVCSAELNSAPVFEILGDINLFSGPRLTIQFANVLLKETKTRSLFHGLATLTKNAPYQYILNAVSTPSIAGALSHAEEVSGLYGISAGAQMTILQNRDGIQINTYSCVLNTALLLNP